MSCLSGTIMNYASFKAKGNHTAIKGVITQIEKSFHQFYFLLNILVFSMQWHDSFILGTLTDHLQ